jgi:hypothetical protein
MSVPSGGVLPPGTTSKKTAGYVVARLASTERIAMSSFSSATTRPKLSNSIVITGAASRTPDPSRQILLESECLGFIREFDE